MNSSLSRVWLIVTPWTAAHQASLSITNSQRLLNLMFIKSWCHPPSHSLSSPSPPIFNRSQHQGLFQWISSSHQVAKVLELHLQQKSFQWILNIVKLMFQQLQHLGSSISATLMLLLKDRWLKTVDSVWQGHPDSLEIFNDSISPELQDVTKLENLSWALKLLLKLKKVWKTYRPFRYDLTQIPCKFTVEVTNRFKGLDLITECLKNYGWRFMTLYMR